MPVITIDSALCKKCGICTTVCPEAILEQTAKATVPQIAHEDECISCGQCVSICPATAIRHADYGPEQIFPLNPERFPSAEQTLELLRTRRSLRALQNKPVERILLEQVIEAARAAPSARNCQSTRFIVIQDPTVLRQVVALTIGVQEQWAKQPGALGAFSRLVKAFAEGKDHILHDAPVLLVFHGDERREFPEANANLALQNAALMAQALGLGCFYAGYVVAVCQKDGSIPALLAIPEHQRIYGALALGYPKVKFKKRMARKTAHVTWLESPK